MYHTLRQIADDNSDDDPDPEKAHVRHLPYRMKHNTTRECRLSKISHMGPIRELLEPQRAPWTRNSTPTDPRLYSRRTIFRSALCTRSSPFYSMRPTRSNL